MAKDGTITPIEPGLIARLVSGVRYAVSGKPPTDWFGPGQPLLPVAQEQAVGRRFDYLVNNNTVTAPRNTEQVTFSQMRQLADSCDLLRLIIETRKDQMAALTWTVKPKKEGVVIDKRCEAISAFLQSPDQEHDWQTWLRILLEEMLVIDAATIYPRPTLGGGLYALEVIDGGTIKRVLDGAGRTPMPPDVAYQQILKGLPAVDYSRDELVYRPRNPRANRVYGYSPVEQIIMTVNISMRRQLHQLQAYTEGNIPEMFIGVPPEWNPDQVRNFQDYFDSLLEGNTAARRHARFIPGGMNVVPTKENLLKDEYDDWLARIVCFAFSIEPTPFVKGTNRATAQTTRAQALTEGLVPTMSWVKSVMDSIISHWFGAPDLQFAFEQRDDVDALTQAQIDQIYVTVKVKTPDEVRDTLGLEPLSDEQLQRLQDMNPPPPALAGAAGPDDKTNPASRQQNEVKPTEKSEIHHHHINVQPPDVLVEIGATTVNATFEGDEKTTKTVTTERSQDGSASVKAGAA